MTSHPGQPATGKRHNTNSTTKRSRHAAEAGTGTFGIKMLVTTASVAATIGGWAALSMPGARTSLLVPAALAQSTGIQNEAATAQLPGVPDAYSGGAAFDVLPLPTLVPEPGGVYIRPSGSAPEVPATRAPQPAALPAANNTGGTAPGASAANKVLRKVEAPQQAPARRPAPMSVTRSSR